MSVPDPGNPDVQPPPVEPEPIPAPPAPDPLPPNRFRRPEMCRLRFRLPRFRSRTVRRRECHVPGEPLRPPMGLPGAWMALS